MFERIIAGVLIGLAAGFVLTKQSDADSSVKNVVLSFIAIISLAFISSSFMFGAVYGGMAIAEIALGYWLSNSIRRQKT